MLTTKELSIALIKAASSNIPIAGSFIAEGIGVIDQHAATLALNERLELLEEALISYGMVSSESGSLIRVSYHCTPNYLNLMSSYEASLKNAQLFEKKVIDLDNGTVDNFEYFNLKAKIPIVHDILVNHRTFGVPSSNLAQTALISFASKILTITKSEDDIYLKRKVGSSSEDMKEYGFLGDTWQELGLQLIGAGAFHDAIRCFFKSVELGSDPMVPLLNIANCFHNLGMLGYAIKKYEVLSVMYPYSLQIRYRLASSLDKLGSIGSACTHYEIFCSQFDDRIEKGGKFPEETINWRKVSEEFINKHQYAVK